MREESLLKDKLLPVSTVVLLLIAGWYVASVFLNAPFERDTAARAGTEIGFFRNPPQYHGSGTPGAACSAPVDRRDLGYDRQ